MAVRKISFSKPLCVIPAKAGIHFPTGTPVDAWIPAFAGMTIEEGENHG
jgi:hypothetical protein